MGEFLIENWVKLAVKGLSASYMYTYTHIKHFID